MSADPISSIGITFRIRASDVLVSRTLQYGRRLEAVACDDCKSFMRGAIIAATHQLADSCELEQHGAIYRFCEIHSSKQSCARHAIVITCSTPS